MKMENIHPLPLFESTIHLHKLPFPVLVSPESQN
jgi:hypothetical protein